MNQKIPKPAWWQVFLLLLGMIVLLILESRDGASNSAHEITDFVIVVAFFGTILWWVHANSAGLEQNELDHTPSGEFHITVYPSKNSTADEQNRDNEIDSDLSRKT